MIFIILIYMFDNSPLVVLFSLTASSIDPRFTEGLYDMKTSSPWNATYLNRRQC